MLGNCATGKLKIVMAPTSTKTMEITIATMGRLIKNFDMALLAFAFHGEWLSVHLHPRSHLLHALGNDALATL